MVLGRCPCRHPRVLSGQAGDRPGPRELPAWCAELWEGPPAGVGEEGKEHHLLTGPAWVCVVAFTYPVRRRLGALP